MAESTPVASVFGRLIVVNSLVWAATMLAAAVVMKATDVFIYLLLVLLAGSSLSGAAIESARRRLHQGRDGEVVERSAPV